jgi:hypothetical protein
LTAVAAFQLQNGQRIQSEEANSTQRTNFPNAPLDVESQETLSVDKSLGMEKVMLPPLATSLRADDGAQAARQSLRAESQVRSIVRLEMGLVIVDQTWEMIRYHSNILTPKVR